MLVKWLAFTAFLLVGGGLLALGIAGLADPPLIRRDLVITAVGVALALNAVVVLLLPAPMWRRRRPEMQASAEQWEGFRHYLEDFPRLADKPADTLPLWERYLIFGITFGIAERVLEAASVAFPAISDSSVVRAPRCTCRRSTRRASRAVSAAHSRHPRAGARAVAVAVGSFGGGRRRRLVTRLRDEEHRALQAPPSRPTPSSAAALARGRPRSGAGPFLRESERLLSRVLGGGAAGWLRSPGRHAQGGDPAPRCRRRQRVRARGARTASPNRRPPPTPLALACLAADDDPAAAVRRRADGRRRRGVRAHGRRARGAGRRATGMRTQTRCAP